MTRPIPVVITRAERFKRLLVWHPINTDPHDDDRWTVRFWLPLFDCLVILAGIIAYSFGSRIMSKLFPEWIVDWAAVVFAIAGFITLVGVCIPRLWRVEVGGKITIAFLLTTYAFLVLTFPQYDQNNAFVCVILIMATWGIYPRLTRLFVRGLHDKAQRKAVKSWARSK